MRIDFMVQKTVVHNFLRIPQSTFPMLESTVHVKSGHCCVQTISNDFFEYRGNFCLNTFYLNVKAEVWFAGTIGNFFNFLRILQTTFPMLQWTVQVKSGRSCAEMIPNNFFEYCGNFFFNTFCLNMEIVVLIAWTIGVFYKFLRNLQTTFPMLQ